MLFTFIFVCVCVCVFFVYMGRIFLTGGECMVPCNCTKDKNSIKQIVACVVCYSGSKYGTYFLITRVYCGFRLYTKNMFLIPPVPINRAAPVFHFIFYFKISIQENGAKTFLSTRSDYACF